MKKVFVLTAFAFSLAVSVSQAQDTPQAEVAVAPSFLYILKGLTIAMGGASGSVALNANHWFGVVADLGVYCGHPGESLTGETYTFGPRFTFRQRRNAPFVQALFGGSHFSASSGGISGGGTEFAFALGSGIDIGLGSSTRFALRPQAEYVGIRAFGSTTNATRLSVGIVYRMGSRAARASKH